MMTSLSPCPQCAQGQKLSAKEERELAYKRQVYELAKLRQAQQEELDARDEYHMPLDAAAGTRSSRYDVLTARYKCAHPKSRKALAAPMLRVRGTCHSRTRLFRHLPFAFMASQRCNLSVTIARTPVVPGCHHCQSSGLFRQHT